MGRLSTKHSWFYTKLWPALFFGILMLIAVGGVLNCVWNSAGTGQVFYTVLLGAIVYFFQRSFLGQVVDEAYFDDGSLTFKKGRERGEIDLINIAYLRQNGGFLPMLSVNFRKPLGRFRRVKILLPGLASLNGNHPLADELLKAVNEIREAQGETLLPSEF